MIDALSVVLRAAGFLCLFQCTGLALFLALFGRELTHSRVVLGRVARRSAALGFTCALAHFLLEPARLAGEFSGVLDPDLLRTALGSASGAAATTRLLGLAGVLIALGRDRSRAGVSSISPDESDARGTFALVAGTLILCSFLLVGHTTVSSLHGLLAALLILHLIGVAFWFGGVSALWIIAREERARLTAETLRAFSRLAVWLVPGILLAGLLVGLCLVPSLEALGHPYGLILLGKLAGFAALLLFASWNKLRLTPAIAAARDGAVQRLRVSLAAEYALIAGVLCATAVMTSLFSPE